MSLQGNKLPIKKIALPPAGGLGLFYVCGVLGLPAGRQGTLFELF